MLRFITLILSVLGVFASSGCVSHIRDQLEANLRARAAFEMACPADQITLTPLSAVIPLTDAPQTQGVSGCGKRLVYVFADQQQQYVLNSAAKSTQEKP